MGKQENTQNKEGIYFEKMCSTPSFYSPNIGIMKKVLDKKSSNYSNLKVFLQKIYEALYPNLDMYNIYEFLQQLNHNDKIVQSSSLLEDSLENLVEKYPRWQPARARNNGSWIQIGYSLKEDNGKVYPAQPEDIKVYATFKDSNIQDVYVKSIEYLLQNARNVFVAKIATCNRADQTCYWLSKEDFSHLENFYKSYSDELVTSMPLVAYKGKLGISKEFPDDSHNATQANIIADYLKDIKDVAQIDVEDMYNNFIAKWNKGDCEERHYCKFKNMSAFSFVVILDTLDAVLSAKGLTNDSFLLNDDKKIWWALYQSRSWEEVNRHLKEEV